VETAVAATLIGVHRRLGTWHRAVDLFIATSEFVRRKLMASGFPRHRICVKPNCVFPDPEPGDGEGGYALFVGRLTGEKGIQTLIRAWLLLRGIPLKLVGSGPLQHNVAGALGRTTVELLGRLPPTAVYTLMKRAHVLIVPSECHEAFGRVAAEAFACALPVIASRVGGLAEIVRDNVNGLQFTPGNPEDLAAKVAWAFENPSALRAMRSHARESYEQCYTPERNSKLLLTAYAAARQNAVTEGKCREYQTEP
jgi:glycosyltransferase involved in cell wall biosynthesis